MANYSKLLGTLNSFKDELDIHDFSIEKIRAYAVENYVKRLNQKLKDLIAKYENDKATAPFCQRCEEIMLLNSMTADDKLTIHAGD